MTPERIAALEAAAAENDAERRRGARVDARRRAVRRRAAALDEAVSPVAGRRFSRS